MFFRIFGVFFFSLILFNKEYTLKMGRLAHAQNVRRVETRQRSKLRSRRSMLERTKRLEDNKEQRKVKLVPVHTQLPSEEDANLLISQISQSCRLPNTSQALRELIQWYSGCRDSVESEKRDSRKREREESTSVAALERMADGIIELQTIAADQTETSGSVGSDDDDADDLKTVLIDVMQSEYGERTLKSLLAALKSVESSKFNKLSNVLIEEFEENSSLLKHHIACRLMSALTFYGSPEMLKKILSLFQQQVRSEEDLVKILRDNHTAHTVGNLLKNGCKDARSWLCEMLSLVKVPKKKKAEGATEKLLLLIEDPVASRVLHQLIDSSTRFIFLNAFDIIPLMNSKRGSSFLRDLFSFENADIKEEEAVSLSSAVLEKIEDQLCAWTIDPRANFVVQKIIALTTKGGKSGERLFEKIVLRLSPQLTTLVSHRVGVHVVCALVDASFTFSSRLIELTASSIISKSNVAELLFAQTGGLAIRALMPILKKKECSSRNLLKAGLEPNLEELCFHEVGNLVAQKYLKEIGIPVASEFTKKVIKDQNYFLSMCCDSYASHVLFALLDCTDSASHTALCKAVTKNAEVLAVHVNGRFLVEKVIPASADLRNELLRQSISLAMKKGTQHILCSLLNSLDDQGIESFLKKLIPNLKEICVHQFGSIAIQKMMQANPKVKAAIQRALKNQDLRSELANNFFGKFVVLIADS